MWVKLIFEHSSWPVCKSQCSQMKGCQCEFLTQPNRTLDFVMSASSSRSVSAILVNTQLQYKNEASTMVLSASILKTFPTLVLAVAHVPKLNCYNMRLRTFPDMPREALLSELLRVVLIIILHAQPYDYNTRPR